VGRAVQQGAPATVAVYQEPLLGILVTEYIQDPGGDRDRLLIQGRLDKGLDPGLGEIFLEGPAPGQHPIPKALATDIVLIGQHHRHHQQAAGQREGPGQRFDTLVEVLDDIDYKAEIDDVGLC